MIKASLVFKMLFVACVPGAVIVVLASALVLKLRTKNLNVIESNPQI